MFTKHVGAVLRDNLMKHTWIEPREGRAATTPQLVRNSTNVDVKDMGSIKTVTFSDKVDVEEIVVEDHCQLSSV